MADLEIRRYESGDADAVWDLHERALRDVGAYDEEFAHLDADLRNVESEYLDAGGEPSDAGRSSGGGSSLGGEFLVGEIDGEIVATGAVQPTSAVDHHESEDDTGVVRRMRVAPDHQGEGYGREMLEALERRARELGFERLVLDTTPRQEAAIGLYESVGYEEFDRGPVEVADHGMPFYEKDL